MTDDTTTNGDSPIKNPDDWTTGDEPATASQLSYLQTLAQDTNEQVPDNLTKAAASELIEALQAKSGRVDSDNA